MGLGPGTLGWVRPESDPMFSFHFWHHQGTSCQNIYKYGFWGSISAGKGRTNTHTHIFTTKLGPSVCFAAGKDYKHLTCKANGYCQFAHTDGLANFKVVKIALVFQMATDLPIMYRNKAKMTNCNFQGLPRQISKSCSYEKCLKIKF